MTTKAIVCPYCQQKAELVTGDVIYPHRPDLHQLQFWQCVPCMAYVGCHRGTTRPLGRLADAELRQAKQDAHAAFDELWKQITPAGTFDRSGAYKWLARQLGIEVRQCHIGMFDVETCRRVVAICTKQPNPDDRSE